MKKYFNKKECIKLLVVIILFSACDNMFEFSPYQANVKKECKNTTAKNLQLINNIKLTADTFSFAFVTDNHYYYDNLKTVIDDINKKDDISFVIGIGSFGETNF